MTTLPANARLCHRCGEHYIGRACPKCPPLVITASMAAAAFMKPVVASAAPGGMRGICAGQFVHPDGSKTPIAPQAPPAAPVATRAADGPRLVLRLTGQVRGGKNNLGRTKTGKSYPKKLFADWRAEAIRQIHAQMPSGWTPIALPCNVRLDYVAEDRQRRDMPAVLDAIFHCMERAGVVKDDTLLWVTQSSRSYDKAAPGVTITFLD